MKTQTRPRLASILALLLAATSAHAAVVYQNTFDTFPIGQVANDDAAKALFFPTPSGANFKGATEGNLSVVTSDRGAGRCIKVKFPAGKHTTGESGIESRVYFNAAKTSYTELYFSYWIKFLGTNFNFVNGGKIPGLAGRNTALDQDHTLRLMWRDLGKVEFYHHYNSRSNQLTRYWWNNVVGQAVFKKNTWQRVEMRYKMNTLGQTNGIMQGWLDGQLVANYSVNNFVTTSGDQGIGMNCIHLSMFFGGSSGGPAVWAPTADCYAVVDDLKVSTTPIGN